MQLFEKLILDEANTALDIFDDVPQIKKLINAGKWDEALNQCENLNTSGRVTEVKLDNALKDPKIFADIETVAKPDGIKIEYLNNDKKPVGKTSATILRFTGQDDQSSWAIVDLIDYCKEKGFISKQAEIKKQDLDSTEVKERIINRYNVVNKIDKQMSPDALKVWNSMAEQLGLNDFDNPFLYFFKHFYHANFDRKDMIGLNNLYAKGIINSDALADPTSILQMKSLYDRASSAQELEHIVTEYYRINSPNKNDLFIKDGSVLPYSKIMNNLKNKSTSDKEKGKATSSKDGDVDYNTNGKVFVSDDDISLDRLDLSKLKDVKNIKKLQKELTKLENTLNAQTTQNKQ